MQKWCKTTTVDFDVALANCMGNRTLLARMLGIFLKNESGFEVKFLAAQAMGDVNTMVRLAHTLKGGAQTMGGTPLSKAAAALETSCQQGVQSELLAQQLKMTLDQLAFAMPTLASLHRDLLVEA
jgi:HPt (histidine-containing phosphotransfer) domain-containing protein